MKLKLVEKKDEAQDTKSFFFETEKEVKYLPGQFFYFTLPKLTYQDARGATRHFTLSSSPTEGKIIRMTTRMRKESGYKKTLDELEIGDTIEGEGPSGEFILDENEPGPHVFLAGGIGITPFRSIIKYHLDKQSLAFRDKQSLALRDKNLPTQMHLIYSSKMPESISFGGELEKWAKDNDNFKLDMVITQAEESKKSLKGLRGRIDETMIKKLVGEINEVTFWICGPPAMVDAMEKQMGKLKVSIGKVRSEKFTGY